MASALSVFNDFMTSTDSAILTSADSIVNEAVKNNYLLRRYLRGKSDSQILQGGKTIKDQILFDEDNTYQYYQPNETFTWKNPQVLEEWEIQWRYSMDHMSWTDQEIELNAGGGLGKSARHAVYKRLKRIKEQRLWTSLLNGMEDALWATPATADMEAAGGTKPYSIPCFVNQGGAETLAGTYTGLYSEDGSSWTTVEGINPTEAGKTKWVPQKASYDAFRPGTTDTDPDGESILGAFDRMYLSVKFEAPPTRQEYFESDKLYAQFIACSKTGLTTYMQCLRANQDQFAAPSRQDPAFLKPTYGGIELEYVSSLDTAKLYLTGASASGTESDGTAAATGTSNDYITGPRYYWLNASYINPVFHTKRYFTRHQVMTHPNQPFTHVQPIDCWHNIVCTSRQRHGIVYPVDGGDAVV